MMYTMEYNNESVIIHTGFRILCQLFDHISGNHHSYHSACQKDIIEIISQLIKSILWTHFSEEQTISIDQD